MVDHLFREQYGKMVAILTRIFGLDNLEIIEDAVQDTFIKAIRSWPQNPPENPEAWLVTASKNRILDIFRKLAVEKKRIPKINHGASVMVFTEVFLETEVSDSQLRMIFTACNPTLDIRDQLAFSLKTISGFSEKEIASALLTKEATVKKRLQRARNVIREKNIQFTIPTGDDLPERLRRVQEVLYLIFNEGFHSNKKEFLIREDLCGEATRLCKLLLKNSLTAQPSSYALFALFCFQSARLKSKVNAEHEVVSLRDQDRDLWYYPLIKLGHEAMHHAVECQNFCRFHYEAAIAAEHTQAKSYEETNWQNILNWYERLQELNPSQLNLMNIALVYLEMGNTDAAKRLLDRLEPDQLEQRTYLYYGLLAEYYFLVNKYDYALQNISKAIDLVSNESEKGYLLKKHAFLLEKIT